EGTLNSGLAFLIEDDEVTFDQFLAVFLDLVGDLAGTGNRVARPDAGRKPDLELTHVSNSRPIGERLGQQSGCEHALREDRGNCGGFHERLIVVQRHEITRCAGIANEVGTSHALDHKLRYLVPDLECFKLEFCCHWCCSENRLEVSSL